MKDWHNADEEEEWIERRFLNTWNTHKGKGDNEAQTALNALNKSPQKFPDCFIENTFEDHFLRETVSDEASGKYYSPKSKGVECKYSRFVIVLGIPPDRLLDLREIIDCTIGCTIAHFTQIKYNTIPSTNSLTDVNFQATNYILLNNYYTTEKLIRSGALCLGFDSHVGLNNHGLHFAITDSRGKGSNCNSNHSPYEYFDDCTMIECCFLSAEDDEFIHTLEHKFTSYQRSLSKENLHNRKSLMYAEKHVVNVSADSDFESDADVREVIDATSDTSSGNNSTNSKKRSSDKQTAVLEKEIKISPESREQHEKMQTTKNHDSIHKPANEYNNFNACSEEGKYLQSASTQNNYYNLFTLIYQSNKQGNI